MGAELVTLSQDVQSVGPSRPRFNSICSQQEIQLFPSKGEIPGDRSSVCILNGLCPSICNSTDTSTSNFQITQQNMQTPRNSDSDHPLWTSQAMVSIIAGSGVETPNPTLRSAEPPSTRSSFSYEPYQTPSSGLEIERRILGEAGCSASVIEALLKARATTTNNTYSKVWEKLAVFTESRGFNPLSPRQSQILDFLQAGLDMGLQANTLRVQVSALLAWSGVK